MLRNHDLGSLQDSLENRTAHFREVMTDELEIHPDWVSWFLHLSAYPPAVSYPILDKLFADDGRARGRMKRCLSAIYTIKQQLKN